ncbi:CidA/LrgA family protein [Clostridium sp. CX1]|nr:CidA/LrgA family protein [Clostridium sp. CX1]MCT8975557.1 CidA/LrgA family protein [Clostridium sp. CX1]
MKIIRQLAIILIICFLGELLRRVLNLTVPGNVMGMIILLMLLCTGIIKVEMIEDISKFLLDHLAFFFLPAGVGLIASIALIKDYWYYVLIIAFISTVVVMVVTGITVQLFKRRESR